VGLLTGWPNTTSSIFASGVDVNPIKVGSRYDFEMMNRAIGYHEMHPVIDSRYPFDQLREALHHLKSGKHFGKIVITF
jgi:NADPH:quinone reductase-like Zn-dependent oxidoreductase